MEGLWEKIDAKLITSVGGIILAGFLSFALYRVLTNEFPHIKTAIEQQTAVQIDTNKILREFSSNVSANNEILRSLNDNIRLLR